MRRQSLVYYKLNHPLIASLSCANLTVLSRYLRPSFAVLPNQAACDTAVRSLASDVDPCGSRVMDIAII